MAQRVAYGHRHLGMGWRELLSVGPDGIEYDGKSYQWSDIKKIKRYDSAFWSLLFCQGGTPVAYVFLKDGKRIRIRGRVLEKEGEKSDVDFLRGTSTTYDALLGLIEEKTAAS